MSGTGGTPGWRLGGNHSAEQWQNKMQKRGWTAEQITEAVAGGRQVAATNNVYPANGATRYIHPVTGRSVVRDDTTGEVIHVGGDDFVY